MIEPRKRGRPPSLRGMAKGPDGEVSAKGRQIIDAARRVFYKDGYDTTSMDAVAREADVSKATVYAHYGSKEALLLAVVEEELRRFMPPDLWVPAEGDAPVDTMAELYAIAHRHADFFLRCCGHELHQLAVEQVHRVPAVGRLFWEMGPRRSRAAMMRFLEKAVDQGDLAISDIEMAAVQFLTLVRGEWPMERKAMRQEPTRERIDAYIDSAVRMFLTFYAAPK